MPFNYPERGLNGDVPVWRQATTSLGRGCEVLGADLRRYGGDPYRAVASYNAGPGAVARWQRQLGGARDRDLFLAWIGYPETRQYVEKVLIDREIYAWILSERSQEES
jgi:soluble lytic murein transglycosylase